MVISISWLTGMQLWRSEYSPFIHLAQAIFCRRLIVVPLTTFHRLAEMIGDPQGELIILFHPGRCGSTLLTQVTAIMDYFYTRMSGNDQCDGRPLDGWKLRFYFRRLCTKEYRTRLSRHAHVKVLGRLCIVCSAIFRLTYFFELRHALSTTSLSFTCACVYKQLMTYRYMNYSVL